MRGERPENTAFAFKRLAQPKISAVKHLNAAQGLESRTLPVGDLSLILTVNKEII